MTIIVVGPSLSVALPASRIFAEQTTALGIESPGTGNPTLTTGDAPDSICPSGWRLPKDNAYHNLMNIIIARNNGSTTNLDTFFLSSPIGLNRAGRYNASEPYGQRSISYYWTRANGLVEFANHSGNWYRLWDRGGALRCLDR